MTLPLTPKQERVWRYVQTCERSPTYREIERALGCGVGHLNSVVVALKEKGFIRYIPGRARSLVALNPKVDLASYPTEALTAEINRRAALDVGPSSGIQSK